MLPPTGRLTQDDPSSYQHALVSMIINTEGWDPCRSMDSTKKDLMMSTKILISFSSIEGHRDTFTFGALKKQPNEGWATQKTN